MGQLKMACDGCGRGVVGIFSRFRDVNGRYLCPTCASNPTSAPKYYCNSCGNHSPTALMKGSGWIELVLYLFYIVPGIIYSVWRRSAQPNVCPICKKAGLVPAAVAKPSAHMSEIESSEETECPHCAEKILVKAKLCKHCGQPI